jgi:hypothetical protein
MSDNLEPQLINFNYIRKCPNWQFYSSETNKDLQECFWIQHHYMAAVNSTQKYSAQMKSELVHKIVTKSTDKQNRPSSYP